MLRKTRHNGFPVVRDTPQVRPAALICATVQQAWALALIVALWNQRGAGPCCRASQTRFGGWAAPNFEPAPAAGTVPALLSVAEPLLLLIAPHSSTGRAACAWGWWRGTGNTTPDVARVAFLHPQGGVCVGLVVRDHLMKLLVEAVKRGTCQHLEVPFRCAPGRAAAAAGRVVARCCCAACGLLQCGQPCCASGRGRALLLDLAAHGA